MTALSNRPTMILIAGANGSGKTTFYHALTENNEVDFGFYINADDLTKEMIKMLPEEMSPKPSIADINRLAQRLSLETAEQCINQDVSFTAT